MNKKLILGAITLAVCFSSAVFADEVFVTGTAAELTPVREIDNRRIGTGAPGPITRLLQDTFFSIVRGEDSAHQSWLTRI